MVDEPKPRELPRPAARPLRSSLKQTSILRATGDAKSHIAEADTPPSGPQAVAQSSRQQYDVDRFTNLLLSGRKEDIPAGGSGPPPVTFQGSVYTGDTSSNTDASSISRQSLFDSIFEVRHDTPKSSYEASPAEEAGAVLPASPLARNTGSKPPVPRARHGNPLNEAPVSVPFNVTAPSVDQSSSGPPTPSKESSPSPPAPTDLNKPLPAPPRPEQCPPPVKQLERANTDSFDNVINPIDTFKPNSPTRSSTAPPLPPARRQSQRRPTSVLSSSNQPETINEDRQSEAIVTSNRTTSPKQTQDDASDMKPPPPPPRRNRPIRNDSRSSISSARSIPSISERLNVSNEGVASSSPVKSPPPIPPSRQPGSGSAKRTSRLLSSSPTAPTPPPPSRLRGSSQSSTSSSVLSADYRNLAFGTDRRDSGSSSTQQTSDDAPERRPSKEKDVMADLTALQREVDELRGNLGG